MPKLLLLLVVLLPLPLQAESALRDPMRPYKQPGKTAVQQQSFVLNAIFVSSRRKLAIVNGERVRIGETINGAVVNDIQADHLKLTLNGRSFTLNLGEGSGA